jgi:lipopolysaccharide transport system ATP-binding protein
MSVVIKVEDLSKQYRLGLVGRKTISHDFNRWWHKVRGKEDPYLKIGQENDRSVKGTSDYVWSLKDINFEVQQGEVLGIIGRNGAGKSTLLKILSKVTSPTLGQVKIKGRIASLLEVGTGFHPDLSGRNNIYLNGAILGMTKKEIKRKFDEIVDFAGVERYIDTPVKRYSSGMYVRLAFAVAAYLEQDILIVDEVLAVGDAEFQKKCLGKMKDVSVKDGRTVLFVSHQLGAVQELCDTGLLMQNGLLKYLGNVDDALRIYADEGLKKTRSVSSGVYDLTDHPNKKSSNVGILSANFLVNGTPSVEFTPGDDLKIEIDYYLDEKLLKPELGIVIKNENHQPLIGLNNTHLGTQLNVKTGVRDTLSIHIPDLNVFQPGVYTVNLYFGDNVNFYETLYDAFQFSVELSDVYSTGNTMRPEWNKIWLKNIKIG